MVAYPADYRSSGVKTFIVSQDGIVYEKDLGPKTRRRSRQVSKRAVPVGTLRSEIRGRFSSSDSADARAAEKEHRSHRPRHLKQKGILENEYEREHNSSLSAASSGTISLGGELTVNRLGFGAMRLTGDGIWGPPKDRAAAIAVLRRAVELGVNFIDTADSYGPNVSEELIAEALAPYPKDLVIATKGGWNRPGPNQWTHDASPAHLREAVEGSLKRLRLDRIDVYQLHVPDPVVPLDASIETLANMQIGREDPLGRVV